LLDIRLPRVDGLEVLKQIKGDPEQRSIPVVILTTSARDEEVARAYDEGVNSYVTKPVEFADFASKVKSIGLYWGLITSLPSGNSTESAELSGEVSSRIPQY
jgi:CheY-like chemotaxis protein